MDIEPTKRGPGRPPNQPVVDTMRNDPRPELRPEDSREAAARRTQEILSQLGDNFDEQDKFFVPPEIKPDGWTYEWKNWTIHNKEDSGYVNSFLRTGWSFVPSDRPGHEMFVPRDWKDKAIIKEGMVLVERPTEICVLVEKRMLKEAREQVRIKEQQINEAPAGTLERNNKGTPLARVKRSISGPIPD